MKFMLIICLYVKTLGLFTNNNGISNVYSSKFNDYFQNRDQKGCNKLFVYFSKL